MTTRRGLLKGVAAVAAGTTVHTLSACERRASRPAQGPRQAVRRVLVLQRARRQVVRGEDLPSGEATRLPLGRTDRARGLDHAQEARARVRHRAKRHARRAVHARVQQPQVPRRGHRAHGEDDRPLRPGSLPECHRLRRVPLDRSRQPQVARHHPRGRLRELRQGAQANSPRTRKSRASRSASNTSTRATTRTR